jgi:hypothetical protein
MPLWLNAELLNLAPFSTGKARLELPAGSMWQLSQPKEPIPMCPLGGDTIAGIIVGIAKAAAFAVLWHCAQLEPTVGALA